MIKLNGTPVVPTIFPDKTSQVWKLSDKVLKETNYSHITWEFQNEAEFIHLAQLKFLIDDYQHKTTLRIKYLPYARQDKIISNNNTFALSVFACLLNTLDFDEVILHDPHSVKALELIKNSKVVYPQAQVKDAYLATDSNMVCYPDKGALQKYSEIYNFANSYGEKVRNQETGQIVDYKLVGNVKNQNVLIVDDICDGGATFILLTKELYKAGAKEVNLFVTHGLFTQGTHRLKSIGINKIFTADGEKL